MSECETCLCESMYSKAEKNDYHHALLASRDAEIARLRAALERKDRRISEWDSHGHDPGEVYPGCSACEARRALEGEEP